MEETLGYEALFSTQEWSSLEADDWDLADEDFQLQTPDSDAPHEVRIYETKDGFDVECELCGNVGLADGEALAEVLMNFHETLQAMVVEQVRA